FTSDAGRLIFDLGTLMPGATVEITYHAKVGPIAAGITITNSTTVTETEIDTNPADNSDSASIRTTIFGAGGGGPLFSGGGSGGAGTVSNNSNVNAPQAAATTTLTSLTILRTTGAITIPLGGGTASEKLIVRNLSGIAASGVRLRDVLGDPSGGTIHEE